jgi:hypothetical protein
MRTLRLSLVGSVILGLCAGLSIGVAAQQDQPELSTPGYATHVTGVPIPTPEGNSYVEEGDHYLAEMDWSDPRLPSRMLFRVNAEAVPGTEPDGSGGAARIAWVVRLEGAEGDWSGTGHSLAWTSASPGSGGASPDARTEVLLLVLDGDGAYEGLSAWLTDTGGGDAPAFEGFIFDKALAMPDPIEPSAG